MRELQQVRSRIQKLLKKKALIDQELEPLFFREEELENNEIIAVCRSHAIGLEELMAAFRLGRAKHKETSKTANKLEETINESKEKE